MSGVPIPTGFSGGTVAGATTFGSSVAITGALTGSAATFSGTVKHATGSTAIQLSSGQLIFDTNGTNTESLSLKVLSVRKGSNVETASITQAGAATFASLAVSGFTANENGTVKAQPGAFSPAAGFQSKSTFPAGSVPVAHYEARSSGNVLEFSVGQGGAVYSLASVAAAGFVLNALVTPASASATGVTGTIVADANYVYVCTASNTWKRAALSTW